jgi:hypothetical protein
LIPLTPRLMFSLRQQGWGLALKHQGLALLHQGEVRDVSLLLSLNFTLTCFRSRSAQSFSCLG